MEKESKGWTERKKVYRRRRGERSYKKREGGGKRRREQRWLGNRGDRREESLGDWGKRVEGRVRGQE